MDVLLECTLHKSGDNISDYKLLIALCMAGLACIYILMQPEPSEKDSSMRGKQYHWLPFLSQAMLQ